MTEAPAARLSALKGLAVNQGDGVTEYAQVVTATETRSAAVELGRSATSRKLAASAQVIGPVVSLAWHLGELVEAEEWQLILKTPVGRVPELSRHLVDNHPWRNPEVSVSPFNPGTEEYRDWLDQVTS